uniref:Uncharacterized protein n=1 Tax=Anguilla anguilla TaxID=7936 RepID=A0A0E9SUA8_ANGAN
MVDSQHSSKPDIAMQCFHRIALSLRWY